MEKYYKFIKITDRLAVDMLDQLAKMDQRSVANMLSWLIRQEYARRYSRPNDQITVGEAIEASEVAK